jgi:hypothetical protein
MSTSNGIHHETNSVHNPMDADIDALYSWFPPPAPAPAPCPEALFSATLKGFIGGHEVLLTARGMTPAEFTANVQAIRGLLDAPAQPAPQPQPQLTPQQHNALAQQQAVAGWCKVHNIEMQENEKDGRRWFSHYDSQAEKWCKGR